MSSIRRTLTWFGLLVMTFGIVAGLRQLVVVPTAHAEFGVRIVNPEQAIVTKPSEVVVFKLTLQNSGSESVVITGCEVGCSCTTPASLPVALPAHSDCNLSFQLTGSNMEGSVVRQQIRIYTVPPIPDLVATVVSQVETPSRMTSTPE